MAYKKVNGSAQYEKIDLTRDGEGTETEGRLVDMREFDSPYGKKAKSYVLELADGEKRSFIGNMVLDNHLPNCTIGNMVKIIFLGTVPSKVRGQNPYKNFEIFEDDGSEGNDESAESATKTAPSAGTKPKGKVPF